MRCCNVCLPLSSGWRRRLRINRQRSEREIRSETGRARRGVNEELRLPSNGGLVSHAGGDRRDHSAGSHEGTMCVCVCVCVCPMQAVMGGITAQEVMKVQCVCAGTHCEVCVRHARVCLVHTQHFSYRLSDRLKMGWIHSCGAKNRVSVALAWVGIRVHYRLCITLSTFALVCRLVAGSSHPSSSGCTLCLFAGL